MSDILRVFSIQPGPRDPPARRLARRAPPPAPCPASGGDPPSPSHGPGKARLGLPPVAGEFLGAGAGPAEAGMEGLEELGLGRGGGGPGQGVVAGPGLGLGLGAVAGPGLGLGPGPAAGPAMGPGLVAGLGPGPVIERGPGLPSSAVAGLPTRLRQWKTSERCFPVPFREVQGGVRLQGGRGVPLPPGQPPPGGHLGGRLARLGAGCQRAPEGHPRSLPPNAGRRNFRGSILLAGEEGPLAAPCAALGDPHGRVQ